MIVPASLAVTPTVNVAVCPTLLFALDGCDEIVGATAGVSIVVTDARVDSAELLY